MRSLAYTIALAAVLASSCTSGNGAAAAGTTAAGAAPPKSGELDKLMRTRMNTSYSQLVFLVFHANGALDYPKIADEAGRLKDTVGTVRRLKTPPMVRSDAALSVYTTFNDTLERDAVKFTAAVMDHDTSTMQTVLTKIGQTCNDCHHFFRIDVEDTPSR